MNEHSSRSHAIFIVTVECAEVGVVNCYDVGVVNCYGVGVVNFMVWVWLILWCGCG